MFYSAPRPLTTTHQTASTFFHQNRSNITLHHHHHQTTITSTSTTSSELQQQPQPQQPQPQLTPPTSDTTLITQSQTHTPIPSNSHQRSNSHQPTNSNPTSNSQHQRSNSNHHQSNNFNQTNSQSTTNHNLTSSSNRFNLSAFILRSSRPNRREPTSNQDQLITDSIDHIMPNNHHSPTQQQQQPIEERSKAIAYFPVLRRMASRRKDKENSNQSSSNSSSNQQSNNTTSTSSSSSLRMPRNRRSISQPPPIPSVIRSATDRLRSNHHLSPTQSVTPQSILSSSHPIPIPALSHPLSGNSNTNNLANSILRNNSTVADLSTTINPTDNTPSPSEIPLINSSEPQLQSPSQVQSPSQAANQTSQSTNQQPQTLYSLRLVPHLDATRSLHFEPIERKIPSSTSLKIGRFTDRSLPNNEINLNDNRIAFKSKVVSRGHADIFTDPSGQFFIKDTKSSSGTFLNHIRLSAPGGESKPFPLRDGDVLQLGVDYQGGTEEIYRCVKMRVELNRGWQRAANNFNQQALAQLRALGGDSSTPDPNATANKTNKDPSKSEPLKPVSDCCICLFGVTVCQALFIAPCSHVYHFKCIRPLLQMHHPGFSCPLCRTFADLEADVETEDQPEPEITTPNQNEASNETELGSPVVISDQIVMDDFNQSTQMDVQATAVGMNIVSSPNALDGQNRDEDILMEDNTHFPDRTLHASPDLNGLNNSHPGGALLSRHDTLHTPIRSMSFNSINNYHPLSNSHQEGGSNGIVVVDRSLTGPNGGIRNPVQKKKEDEQMELLNEDPCSGLSES